MERHRLMDKEAIRRIDHSAECFFTGALTAHAIEATDEQGWVERGVHARIRVLATRAMHRNFLVLWCQVHAPTDRSQHMA